MKKFTSALLLVSLLASLAVGCSNAPAGSSENSGNESTGGSSATSENVTLEYNTYQTAEKDRVEAAIADFESKNPNIKVNATFYPGEQYVSTMKAKFSSNSSPDIFQVWVDTNLDAFIEAGYVADITDIDASKKIMPNVKELLMSSPARKDKIYALPEGVAGLGMISNMDVLKDAGVTEVPENYADFVAACEKIQSKGIQPIAYGDKDGTVSSLFGIWGSDLLMDDATANKLINGEVEKLSDLDFMKETYQKIGDLRKFFIDGWSGTTYDQASAMVGQGESAFLIAGEWGLTAVKTAAEEDTELVFSPIPITDEDSHALITIPGGISMSSSTKNKDAAIAYLNYFASSDYFKNFKPTNPVAFEGVTAELPQEDITFSETYLPDALPSRTNDMGAGFGAAVPKALQEYLADENMKVEDALTRADEFFVSAN